MGVDFGEGHQRSHRIPDRVLEERRLKVGDKVKMKSKSVGMSWQFFSLKISPFFEYARVHDGFLGRITKIAGDPYRKQDHFNYFLVGVNLNIDLNVVEGLGECDFGFAVQDLELLEPVEEREGKRVKKEDVTEEKETTRQVEPVSTAEVPQEQQNPLTAKEQKARAILAWYLAEYLLKPKEGNIYPLVNRHAKEPANENEYETLFTERTTDNVRIAMKELALFLYKFLTGHSERTDPSFLLEYPPLKQYNSEVSDFLATTIHQMIGGKYKNLLALKETLEQEKEREKKKEIEKTQRTLLLGENPQKLEQRKVRKENTSFGRARKIC